MSVQIKLIKNNIKRSSSYGKYFAKTVSTGEITLRKLAEEACSNCSIKRSDMIAVITELEDMMKHRLADGKTIVIDGIGRFSLRAESIGVDDPKTFNIRRHMKRTICRFLPAGHRTNDGKISYNFSEDVVVRWRK